MPKSFAKYFKRDQKIRQIQADSWLPGNGRPDNLDPRLNANIQWANTRITKNLLGNFPSPVYPTGQV